MQKALVSKKMRKKQPHGGKRTGMMNQNKVCQGIMRQKYYDLIIRNIRIIPISACFAEHIWVQKLNFNRKLLKYRNISVMDGSLQMLL